MRDNRFCLMVFSFLVFVYASVVYSAPTRGIVPVPIKDKGGNQVLLYKESHALVVGVSEYASGWPRLPGVMDDLHEVIKSLESQGFNVVIVRNPTRESLEKAFNDFINKYGRGEDNRLLFYFAGHGYTDKPKHGGEMGYIVPSDAPDPNRDLNGFLNKAMDMEMFNVYAKRIRAKHALFLFDSCFSGSLFALSRAIPEFIQEKTSKPVRQFITAGTAEQTVPDRSIFRDQLVRALNGEADMNKDGYVTGTELGQFLEEKVTNYSRRSQTPKYGKISDPNLDKGDFVFALHMVKTLPDVQAERKRIGKERLKLAEELKTVEEKEKLNEEKRKLEEERQKLEEAKKTAASLPHKKSLNSALRKLMPTSEKKSTSDSFEKSSSIALDLYAKGIQEKVYSNWKCPQGASNKGSSVSFFIFPNGYISGPIIEENSGDKHTDELASQAIRDSEPFPNFPPDLKEPRLHFTIKLRCELKGD